MKEAKYECRFCKHKFVHENRFLVHRCKAMIRDEDFRSAEGQAAWLYYQKWMKAYRRLVPAADSFLHSKFFNSFLRFARFVKTVHLPDVDIFIWLMKERDISPSIWTNDQVYSLYLEFIDRKSPPLKQAEITVHTLLDIADENEIDVGDVFEVLTPNEVIQLLRQRRLSPWVLLHSTKFKKFFIERTTSEEKIILETIIRYDFWKKKFESQKDGVEYMKRYVAELSL